MIKCFGRWAFYLHFVFSPKILGGFVFTYFWGDRWNLCCCLCWDQEFSPDTCALDKESQRSCQECASWDFSSKLPFLRTYWKLRQRTQETGNLQDCYSLKIFLETIEMCVLMKIWFGFKSWSSERSTITLSCWNICLVSITWWISWSFTWVSATRYTLLFHLLFVIFTFLFTKMDIQLKIKRIQRKMKKKWGKTTAVCRHWGWKLFTPNIWQAGNNNKIRWQNSRAVYNQDVCVFTACIIHFWSWFLWRRRVGSWFCADRFLYICKYALFKEYWRFFRHWDLSS